jgi:ornithine cyclodeaminase/alanine dehydrogenase-like protein (mu-crystallin family)
MPSPRIGWRAVIPVLGHDAVLAAVPAAAAIERTRAAFLRHRAGEWTMPAKVYLQSPPFGDFRAMPALGDGVAMLKWISSFPGNPPRGLPTVLGLVVLSDASTSEPLALLDARSVTALRTGAAAAVAAQALALPSARTVGIVGSGLHGAWSARCLVAAGYGPGVCHDAREEAAAGLAAELGPGWRVGSRQEALACDVVCCVTPGAEPVVDVEDLHDGLHLNMLGADGPGKAEATIDAVAACALFCDEWEQASHGGELTGAVASGRVSREDVTELGDVLLGRAPGRRSRREITIFKSLGLAVEDVAAAAFLYNRARAEGRGASVELGGERSVSVGAHA